MKKNFYLSLLIIAIAACNKHKATIYDAFDEEYNGGSIQMQYKFRDNGNRTKDTVIALTSRVLLDYSQPANGTILLGRANPDIPGEVINIQFARTNLNTLSLPYTFSSFDADIAPYVALQYEKFQTWTDSNGVTRTTGTRYGATSADKDFKVTILKRDYNRLQGTFTGKIKQAGGVEPIDVRYGLFDILITQR